MSILEQKGNPQYDQVVKTLNKHISTCLGAKDAQSFSSICILVSFKFNGKEFQETIIINGHQGITINDAMLREFFEQLFFDLTLQGLNAINNKINSNVPDPRGED